MAQIHVTTGMDNQHAAVVEPVRSRTPYKVATRNERGQLVDEIRHLEPGDWRCGYCGAVGHEWTKDEQLAQIVAPAGPDALEALWTTQDNLFGGVKWSAIRLSVNTGDGSVWETAWAAGTSQDRAAVLAWIRSQPADEISSSRTLTWAELRDILLEGDGS